MRRLIAPLMAGALLVLGVARDDNEEGGAQNHEIDEDDTRVGPGDGKKRIRTGPVTGLHRQFCQRAMAASTA